MQTASFRLMGLVQAVIQGDLTALMDSITPSNVNYTDAQYRMSLLMWAVALGRLPTAELLLSRGASLGQVDRYGFTLLHRAVWSADVSTIHMVLFTSPLSVTFQQEPSSLALPSSRGGSASTASVGAAAVASTSAPGASSLKRLLTWRPGAQRLVNAAHTPTGRTPLMLAALGGHEDVIRFLLVTCGADPYPRDANDLAAIDLAALCGNLRVVRLLLNLTVGLSGVGSDASDVFPATQCGAEEYVEIAKTIPQRERLHAVNKLLNESLAEASRVAAA